MTLTDPVDYLVRQEFVLLMDWDDGTGYYQCRLCHQQIVFRYLKHQRYSVVMTALREHLSGAHNIGTADLIEWAGVLEHSDQGGETAR